MFREVRAQDLPSFALVSHATRAALRNTEKFVAEHLRAPIGVDAEADDTPPPVAVATLARTAALTALSLADQALAASGLRALAVGVASRSLPSLAQLDVSHNMAGAPDDTANPAVLPRLAGFAALLRALATLDTLRTLDASANGFGERGRERAKAGEREQSQDFPTGAAAALLRSHARLARLRLSDNFLGARGAQKLAAALCASASCVELNVSWNEVGDDGARHFAEALQLNHSLTRLDLSGNGMVAAGRIGPAGVAQLQDALQRNTTVRCLELLGSRPTPAQRHAAVGSSATAEHAAGSASSTSSDMLLRKPRFRFVALVDTLDLAASMMPMSSEAALEAHTSVHARDTLSCAGIYVPGEGRSDSWADAKLDADGRLEWTSGGQQTTALQLL